MAKAHPHLLVCELAGWKIENKGLRLPLLPMRAIVNPEKMTQNARTK